MKRGEMRLRGRTAVVTGAASGIGRALAFALAERGCNLALVDIDEDGLAKVTAATSVRGVAVSSYRLDVADRDGVAALPEKVRADHGRVDLLFNNAGVAIGGTFEQVSEEDFDWLFSINFFGVVRMTRGLLPLLKESDDARIINLSSVFGLIAPPGHAAYVASKFAVRGFSLSLRHELEGTNVGVTVVHPGGVATSISDSARVPKDAPAEIVEQRRAEAKRFLRMPPETAAEIILKAVERRQPRVLVGNDAKAAAWLERVSPTAYWRLLGRYLKL
jgi:NAD(P)-dependent dehydrogenase (short-subunit alcohol dehydrogenase family)